jgi:hypothetical protein
VCGWVDSIHCGVWPRACDSRLLLPDKPPAGMLITTPYTPPSTPSTLLNKHPTGQGQGGRPRQGEEEALVVRSAGAGHGARLPPRCVRERGVSTSVYLHQVAA